MYQGVTPFMWIQCCAVTFLNIFAIDEKRVRTVLPNKTASGTPIVYSRGRHEHHKRKEREELCNWTHHGNSSVAIALCA